MQDTLPQIRESLLQQLPVLSPVEQDIARSLYLLLFKGRPVETSEMANTLGLPIGQVEDALASLTELERNAEGAVTAFRGLTTQATKHAIARTAEPGVVLHSWCAFDTLFLAGLVAEPVSIRTCCPQTGASLSLEIDVTSANRVSNGNLRVSFPCINGPDYRQDLRRSFCRHVQFFRDEQATEDWRSENDSTLEFLTVNDALDLALDRNRALLGSSPGRATRSGAHAVPLG